MRLIVMLTAFVCLLVACRTSTESSERKDAVFSNYLEPYRPQYHFTPPSGWMNDPNGMVFHNGEYHLFYQHYPDSTVWGPMHWGHAVSSDLVHWEHLPIALYPDSLGYIFSGSAVVDRNNTTGFGSADKPAMVAMFTYHDPVGEKAGRNDFQTQGLAYSNDNGRTWVKFNGNPVLQNPGIRDFRDPKVRWWQEQKKWLLTLAVKDHVEFYSSPDMKTWTRLSAFGEDNGAHSGVWECPDFFPMTDEQGQQRWVLLLSINPGGPQGGSATQYFVGSFNGKVFVPQDTLTRWIDYGADNYAGVTWGDIPEADGRRLFMGWMSNWQYANVVPTGVWRSAMTLPREISLVSRGGLHELRFRPADELEHLTGPVETYADSAALAGTAARIRFAAAGTEGFELSLLNAAQETWKLTFAEGRLLVDRTQAGRSDFSNLFAAIHEVDMTGVNMRDVDIWLDAASLEIFINGGERVITDLVFPTTAWNQIRLVRSNPEFTVQSVARAWPDEVYLPGSGVEPPARSQGKGVESRSNAISHQYDDEEYLPGVSPSLRILIRFLSMVLGPFILYGLLYGLFKAAEKIFRMIKFARYAVFPPRYIRLLKRLQESDAFVLRFTETVRPMGGSEALASYVNTSWLLAFIPETTDIYNRFCEEEGMDKKTAEEAKDSLLYSISILVCDETSYVLRGLFKKQPELAVGF